MRTAFFSLSLLLVACTGKSDGEDTSDTGDAGESGGTGDDGGGGEGGGDAGGTGDDGGGSTTEPDWPTGDPAGCDLTAAAYNLDFYEARVLAPVGIGSLLLDPLGKSLSVGFTAQTETSADAYLAFMESGAQDTCTPTVAIPTGTWTDPLFQVGPADFQTDIDGNPVVLSSFQLAAATNADCSALVDGVFIADLDARENAALLGGLIGSEDPADICDALLGFGAACVACAVDSEPYCLNIVVDQIPAAAVETAVVPRSAEDVAADEGCG